MTEEPIIPIPVLVGKLRGYLAQSRSSLDSLRVGISEMEAQRDHQKASGDTEIAANLSETIAEAWKWYEQNEAALDRTARVIDQLETAQSSEEVDRIIEEMEAAMQETARTAQRAREVAGLPPAEPPPTRRST